MLDDILALQNTMRKEERANSQSWRISRHAARLGQNNYAAIHNNINIQTIRTLTISPKDKEQGSDSFDPVVHDGELTQEDALPDYPSEPHKVLSLS